MTPLQHTYILPSGMTTNQLLKDIKKTKIIKAGTKSQSQSQFFDTFDWRLYRNSWGLSLDGNQLNLLTLENERILTSQNWNKRKLPHFISDFPESDLKDFITPVLSIRGLIPLAKIMRERQSYRILNNDEKTILMLHLDTLNISNNEDVESQLILVDLQPLRGYANHLTEMGSFLNSIGLQPSEETEIMMGVKSVGLNPGDYTSKFNLQLEKSMTAFEALQKIYLTLSQVILINKPGIIQDIDIEFLHDYRVAIRRTRAGLNQIRGVLPPSWELRFKQEFANLGKMCNHLRDLDVYLLEEKNYRSLLPASLKEGLNPLFSHLLRERNREQKKVSNALQDPASDQIIHTWQSLLQNPVFNEEQPNAHRPVLELANELILIRYEKVLKFGEKIKPDSPDEKLHRLRLQCKKLRYLLEFFASLYSDEKINFLIKQLKQLQDNLGTFNDLFVQQNQLQASLDKLNKSNKNSLEEAAAIGGLLAVLFLKQQQVKSEFNKAFKRFASVDNQSEFHELFGHL